MADLYKRDTLVEVDRMQEALDRLRAQIQGCKQPDLLYVGSAWMVSGDVVVTVGSCSNEIDLTVADARRVVARLVAAIYCCMRGGNTENPEAEAREHRFLDALKTGLFHALDDDAIRDAVHGLKPEPSDA